MSCVFCGSSPCDPAHVIPRSLGGCDAMLCVIPLCRRDHRLYDEGALDLLPYLEPHFREELGHALQHVGLMRLLERVTGAPRSAQEALP